MSKYPIWQYSRVGELWQAVSSRGSTAAGTTFLDLALMIVRLENNEPFELIKTDQLPDEMPA